MAAPLPESHSLLSSLLPLSFEIFIFLSETLTLNLMEYEPTSSVKNKLRSSIRFSCCFRGAGCEIPVAVAAAGEERPLSLIRSSSVWLRSKAQELPEIKDRCCSLISRRGRQRRHSSDFGYDPLSYALNFDEGFEDDALADEEFRYRNFSSRLPASPPQPPPPSTAVGIAC
ncbi:uncharacterized protein LOC103715980 [Phoenix dactylifera]|uniref:Uncharacterized protein LOC103715980 n=1 Tax=Phoenix dactylifera TaxID=42345 RepID=A0A8B7CM17_PHODC|nr:uncharacterized protein LOC103715980 [Phoenix dactylifera]